MTRLVACLALALVVALPAVGAEPPVETRDGVPHVMNPATPLEGATTIALEELWRLGGDSEDEEEFFGVIGDVAVDDAGFVYLLDRQLSEVKVYDTDGVWVATLGREGDGPGEFRRPANLFLLGGDVGVIQMMPGRVTLLTEAGDPAGEVPLPEADGGARRMIMGGGQAGDSFLLQSNVMNMNRGAGEGHMNSVLASYDLEGNELARFHELDRTMNFANPVIREKDTFRVRWAALADGRIALLPEVAPYLVEIRGADGALQRVIHREYTPLPRTGEEMEEAKGRFRFRGPMEPKIEVLENHPDIADLDLGPDGNLWILTSRGSVEKKGVIGTFDVFDPEGRFVRQVTLTGEGSPRGDGYFFAGDRLFVVRHMISGMQAMFGGSGETGDTDDDAEPISVIAYRIPGFGGN